MAAAVEASHQPQRHHPDLPDMTPTKLGLEWPLLPEDAPAILRQDTIHVTEPYYVLTLRKKARKEQFVSLINRYIIQLRDGCQHPACNTLTCLTWRQRISVAPVLRMTTISARTVACYLATQDEPEVGLCPHLATDSDNRGHSLLQRIEPSHTHVGNGVLKKPPRPVKEPELDLDSSPYAPSTSKPGRRRTHNPRERTRATENVSKQFATGSGYKSDPKSFTQRLFNTVSLESLQSGACEPRDLLDETRGIFMDRGELKPETPRHPRRTMKHAASPRSIGTPSGHNLPSPTRTPGDLDCPSDSTPRDSTETRHGILAASSNGHVKRPNTPRDAKADRRPFRFEKPPSKAPQRPRRDSWNGAMMPRLPRPTVEDGDDAHDTTSRELRPEYASGSSVAQVLSDRSDETTSVSANRPQSLSHLSVENVAALAKLMKRSSEWPLENRQSFIPFLNQSIFYSLSSPAAMASSFSFTGSSDANPTLLSFRQIDEAFRTLLRHDTALVLGSLWLGLEALFMPPSELTAHKSARSKPPNLKPKTEVESPTNHDPLLDSLPNHRHLHDREASHIIGLSIHTLLAVLPATSSSIGVGIQRIRAQGKAGPDTNIYIASKSTSAAIEDMMECIDILDDEMAQRLVSRLLRAVAVRLYFEEAVKSRNSSGDHSESSDLPSISSGLLDGLWAQLALYPDLESAQDKQSVADSAKTIDTNEASPLALSPRWSKSAMLIEWIRTVIIRNWDGKLEISRFSVVGAAITILSHIYDNLDRLDLSPDAFYMHFISDALDPMDLPLEWQSLTPSRNIIHLLAYPFLFPPSALVTFFRAMNFSRMSRAFEDAIANYRLLVNMAPADPAHSQDDSLMTRMRIAICPYLVLEARREHLLADAMDQLWRRQKRELMRPLKIRVGKQEGEEGVDHGGVQQEFFRIALAKAMNPDYGLFTTDSRTMMSWFRPHSLEPLYKFELLGLLLSLAIYNGVTLPLTFPLALYRRLLDLPVTNLYHISDGWPELTKGLGSLLEWSDGDVGEVFMRTYQFSIDAIGTTFDIDMEKSSNSVSFPPAVDIKGKGKAKDIDEAIGMQSPTAEENGYWFGGLQGRHNKEIKLVTNENREQYVKDYIVWLTNKSIRPQYDAFARGFFACLDKKALSIFTPEALQHVVEGTQDVDMNALEEIARYEDGFSANHWLIKSFWSIVKQYSPDEKRALLGFVTASDRVPVSGIRNIMFVLQKNGPDSERVPTSLTCFGRLLMPEYSSEDKLREKLHLALENGKGFGVP